MTTDEALEYCKRFDDPKLQSAMATDFSRAMGSVGALLALRTENAALKAKCRELDAWLDEQDDEWRQVICVDGEPGDVHHNARGHRSQVRMTHQKLRELGLLARIEKEGE